MSSNSSEESAQTTPETDERGFAVRVRDVSKTYQVYTKPHNRLFDALGARMGRTKRRCFEVPAVKNLTFDLRHGESIAIIGRNGSGKSTTLEMLCGTLSPTSGVIEQHGRISALLELGAGFNPDFTGRENFRLTAAIQGLTQSEIDAIESEVEAFADIGGFIDEPVRTYSSGMYVRLAFGAAVHVSPDILIVDEALAVGDIFFQAKCFDFMRDRLGHVTKVLVTHDLASAVRLADRILVMDKGHLIFDGDPLEAVEVYTRLHLKDRSVVAISPTSEHQPDAGTQLDDEDEEFDADQFVAVDPDNSSNPDTLRLNRLRWARTNADGTSIPTAGSETVARPGDTLRLDMNITLGTEVNEPVFGYLVRDRIGNTVFGQSTLGSGIDLDPLTIGNANVSLEFEWPEVAGGEYSVVVGLGDGRHPLHHQIVAWVQGAAKVTSVPERDVHGFFNGDLKSATVRQRRQ